MMRFLYGVVAAVIWIWIGPHLVDPGTIISQDTQFLSLAIIIAGAMAGGGD